MTGRPVAALPVFLGANRSMKEPIIDGNRITVPSNHDFLPTVDDFLEGILRQWKVDESIIADIAISVSELVNNAITHGNKLGQGKSVSVEVDRSNGEAKIAVSDQGSGFDLTEVDNPLDSENLMKEVGRGIFIVRALMDSVKITVNEAGTTIVITKSIN